MFHTRTLAFVLLLSGPVVRAQVPLRLDSALAAAERNFPFLGNRLLTAAELRETTRQINRNWLPQLSLNGQMTYQSDVPELPFALPVPLDLGIPNNQYRAWAEINQTIYDGGVNRSGKELEKAQADLRNLGVDLSLQQLKKQVVSSFFLCLKLEKQQAILATGHRLLTARDSTLQTALEQGIIQPNDLLRLRASLLEMEQQQVELEILEDQSIKLLALLTGSAEDNLQPVADAPSDIVPGRPNVAFETLDARRELLNNKMAMTQTAYLPKVSAFFQGGVGNPNPYNFFKAEDSGFYLAGLRATWQINSFFTASSESKKIRLQQQALNLEEDQLRRETDARRIELNHRTDLLAEKIRLQETLLEYRKTICERAAVQLDEGMIAMDQYLDEVLAQQKVELELESNRLAQRETLVLLQLEPSIKQNAQ